MTDLRARLHALRWRLAARVGQALAGGRLGELGDGLARADERGRQLDRRQDALAGDLAEASANAERRIAALERALATVRDAVADDRRQRMPPAAAVAHERAHGDALAGVSHRRARSIAWLAEWAAAAAPAPVVDEAELVSVIMPVWNRADVVDAAIDSVVAQSYRRWELIVVDDGSEDATRAVLARRAAGDPRVRVLERDHGGDAAARNTALAASLGTTIAYLDSDNTWFPDYLTRVVAELRDPAIGGVYLAQLVHDQRRSDWFIRYEPFDREALERANYIDINVFAHRRRLYDDVGGFDESFARLIDWDLILRYSAAAPVRAVPALGGRYLMGRSDQVSTREPLHLNIHQVRRKLERPAPLRVLYAVSHYPQLGESHDRAEIAYLVRRGVSVSVWRERPPAAAYPSPVPIHQGTLDDAVRAAHPDVVHVHGLEEALAWRAAATRAGVPLTVRARAEVTPDRLRALDEDPAVARIHVFPHLLDAAWPRWSTVRATPVAFDAELYQPETSFDPRLVVRAAAATATADLETFIRVASRCSGHRFVLVVCRMPAAEPLVERLEAYNSRLGGPVELRVDQQPEEVAALLRRAGIHLHTHASGAPYGMPISIAESMACGAWQVARRGAEAVAYVGDAGATWETEDEAVVLIQATGGWDAARWQAARTAAIERAFAHYVDSVALRPVLDDWLALRGAP